MMRSEQIELRFDADGWRVTGNAVVGRRKLLMRLSSRPPLVMHEAESGLRLPLGASLGHVQLQLLLVCLVVSVRPRGGSRSSLQETGYRARCRWGELPEEVDCRIARTDPVVAQG